MTKNKVYLSSFRGKDDTETFGYAMAYLRENPDTTLIIDPGIYNITSDLARETQHSVMTGKFGNNPERIMFNPKFEYTRGISFAGQKGTRVEGYGATILVDGFMEPVSLRDCTDIELYGITIDHKRKPYSRGIVKSIGEFDTSTNTRECIIEFDPMCPITQHSPMTLRYFFFDTQTYKNKHCGIQTWKFIDQYHIWASVTNSEKLNEGVEFYTVHTFHSRPAILIENAERINITDVTIHSQPGMGIVGNRSEDITITRLSVVPSLGHHMSTNTDATHFTSIKGLLRVENCTFEGQGDDFVNVHSYYQAIIKKEGDRICLMQEKTPDGTHAQSLDYPDVGDTLELTNRRTMLLCDTFKVVACTPMPDEWMCRIVLDHPLPENTEDFVLADVTRIPKLEVVGCNAFCHFARSILIKTRGVLIERNTFRDVQGPAIYVAPEAWWYEGISPADVTIRRNRIINCGYAWGDSAISVLASSDEAQGQCLNNITIEDNIIEVPNTSHGIIVKNTDGVKITRNQIICKSDPIIIDDCVNILSDF